MTLRLNGSTSGYTAIDAPAVAGSNTLVLPTGNGSSQQVLATNGSGALSWSNRPILQVVSANYSTSTSNSTSTYADTGLTASITPSNSSNKILVLVAQNGLYKTNGNLNNSIHIQLVRGSTALIGNYYIGYTGTTSYVYSGSCSFCYLDSPATTSAVTYKTQFLTMSNAAAVYVQSDSSVSNITLLEVAA